MLLQSEQLAVAYILPRFLNDGQQSVLPLVSEEALYVSLPDWLDRFQSLGRIQALQLLRELGHVKASRPKKNSTVGDIAS